jgi:RimJ/RimL family protein N-acetyltransferase/catechol 2,3-dioxygenase-like lactoylglutathione lyase family enzyme
VTPPTFPSFDTERLWLRPLVLADADDLHVARGDEEAMRWWFQGTSPSPEVTRDETAWLVEQGSWWGFGRTGERTVLGYVGFHRSAEPEPWYGLGYLVRRDEWGRGLVVEAGRRLLAWAFDEVGIRFAELWIHAENRQSQRVAEKLGARFRGWALTGRRSVVYGVTRDEWYGGTGTPDVFAITPAMDVSDLRRAIALWCDGLGCRVDFDTGQTAHVASTWTGGPGVRLRVGDRFDGRVLVSVGTEVDELAERGERAGWVLASAPVDQPWGAREAVLQDPDGNTVWLSGLPRGETTSEQGSS